MLVTHPSLLNHSSQWVQPKYSSEAHKNRKWISVRGKTKEQQQQVGRVLH